MSTESERMQILEMIESGKITPAEGLALLDALEKGSAVLTEGASPANPEEQPGESSVQEHAFSAQASPVDSNPEVILAPDAIQQPLDNHYPVEPVPPSADRSGTEGEAQGTVQGDVIAPPTIGPDFRRWRSVWLIPLWIGVGITILSGLLMFQAFRAGGFGFWFACTWFPFLFGVAVMALAWGSRNLPWLHLRIQQKPGERPQNINISFPLPTGLARWGLRLFKDKIPNTGNVNLDEVVSVLEQIKPDAPFSLDVDEGEDGEKVQIYIG